MAAQVAHVSNKIADGYFTCWGFPALLRHCPIQRRPLWVAASSRVKMPYTFASQARWTDGQWFYVIFLLFFFVLFYANFMPIFRSDFIIFIWHRHHMAGAHFPIAEMAAVLDQIGGLESAKVIMARRYAWGAPGRFFLGKRAGWSGEIIHVY